MEITKEALQSYRDKRYAIRALENRLRNKSTDRFVGNDVIFDYRTGYPRPQSVVGVDVEKKKRSDERDMKEIEKLKSECEEIEDWVESIDKYPEKTIFRMYYIDGESQPTQSKVAKAVHLDRSRISRKIDEYLENAHKAQSAHV